MSDFCEIPKKIITNNSFSKSPISSCKLLVNSIIYGLGNLPISEVPQMVLITFDDAVNDLNKMYYEELFERGRINPNGCPITATFYVSHEWTDYSQVQNLYADGHEFASHTIS